MMPANDPVNNPMTDIENVLLDAIEPHIVFEGWSDSAFDRAAQDAGIPLHQALAACPRKAVNLVQAYHRRGDRNMVKRLHDTDLSTLRYTQKVGAAIQARLDVVDKEIVRRGVTLLSLPHLAPTGTALVWGTADTIWTALGDISEDYNWYSKRAVLSGVYASCVIFWLGDDANETPAFIDRRLEDVMRIEKTKSALRTNPLTGVFMKSAENLLSGIKAPRRTPPAGFPGYQRSAPDA